jgi:glycosyltransferase involved in cell wall biosynthesis
MAKKILYLITKSNYGGAQKYVFDLATNLSRTEFEIAVAAGGTGAKGAEAGLLALKLSDHNVRFYKINSFTRDIFFINELKAFFEVGQLIRTVKPDVLHLNSSKAAGVGGFVGRILGVRNIVYTVHGWPFNEKRSAISRTLIYFFSWLTCFLVHKVIVINQTDIKQGKKMWLVSKKMQLIYNGLSPITFVSREEARKELGKITSHTFSDSDLLLGTIAELHPNKNLATLIKAVSQDLYWKLIIIGEGQDRKNLEYIIQKLDLTDRVFLSGFITDASRLLKAFDLLPLFSLKEGLPYVILEAGQAHISSVGSDIPGINTIISHTWGSEVLVMDPQNTESVRKVLNKLARDKNLRQTIADNLHQKVKNEFSIEKMIQETINLY